MQMRLQILSSMVYLFFAARLWWNWQTRYFEVVVGQPVQVQVLLSAPIFSFAQSDSYFGLSLVGCLYAKTAFPAFFNGPSFGAVRFRGW